MVTWVVVIHSTFVQSAKKHILVFQSLVFVYFNWGGGRGYLKKDA